MLPTPEELGCKPSPFREGIEELPDIPAPPWGPYIGLFAGVLSIVLLLAIIL